MEMIQRGPSDKQILVLLIFSPMILATGIVTLIHQSNAADNNNTNGSTTEIITKNKILSEKSKVTSGKIITKIIHHDQVSGSGSGQVTCPDGKRVDNAEISFFAFMSKAPLYGSWEVVADNALNKAGSLHSGSVATDHYTLNGREISDKICGISTSSSSIDIHTTAALGGHCGQGVTIELNANNGERGTFSGDVDCRANATP